jgi:hypothetical protein
LGFPPITSQPEGSGGIPPAIGDVNGALKALSGIAQWFQVGAPIFWDSAFCTAIGGYPQGAVVQQKNNAGQFWYNPIDANTHDSDDISSGNWTDLRTLLGGGVANISAGWATGTIVTTSSTFQSAGTAIGIAKKKATNKLWVIGVCNVQNDVSTSPHGCNAGFRLAQNSGGSYVAFGNTMELANEVTGQAVQAGGSGVLIFGENGTLPASYNVRAEFNSADGSSVHMTFSGLIAIEMWAP